MSQGNEVMGDTRCLKQMYILKLDASKIIKDRNKDDKDPQMSSW